MSESKARLYGMIGVGAAAILAIAYLVYVSKQSKPLPSPKGKKSSTKKPKKEASAPEDNTSGDDLAPPSEPLPAVTKQVSTDSTSSVQSPKVAIVEDVEDDENEEEAKRLRKEYDHILKRAKQYLQGEKWLTAAGLFSEAIELASKIPSASKDMLALYNNRGAMYEKNGDFENALMDIMVVLTMDSKHLKARTRRARILESQGKHAEALKDYVFCSILEGASGQPQSNGPKIADLCKKVSVTEVTSIVARMRNSPSRPLPNKGYCRNYFESLASYHEWKRAQINSLERRNELVRRSYHELKASPVDAAKAELNDIVELIKLDLTEQEFSKAFAHCPRALKLLNSEALVGDTSDESIAIKTFVEDMIGIEMHLRCNLTGAMTQYISALRTCSFSNLAPLLRTSVGNETAVMVSPSSPSDALQKQAVEIALRLASLYLELGEKDKSAELYAAALASTSEYPSCRSLEAWVLIHRVSLHITRDALGNFAENGVNDAIADLEQALELTKDAARSNPVVLQCRVMALLKLVHVISQTKVQMGQQPTDVELELVSNYIQEAKRLSPLNESVILLDADLLSINGDTDAALARCDEVILMSDKMDSIPFVIKANVMMQKVLVEMQMAQAQQSQQMLAAAQNTMKQVDDIFTEAIRIEPNGLEAFAQYAQLKSMVGELDVSLAFLEKALENCRSKDEVQELCVIKVQTLAQQAAIEEYKATQG